MPTHPAQTDLSKRDDWSLPDGTDRCPACGRFTSLDDGYGDVEPGGVRGSSYIAAYCSRRCTSMVRCAHGFRLTDTCTEGCEV